MCPTILGKRVSEFCMREFSNLFNYDFTKHMEDSLDNVEKGSVQWQSVCQTTLNSYKEKYEALKSVPTKEISSSKKKVLKDGYEAVMTRNGPLIVKDKKFLGWPKNISFDDINDSILDNFLETYEDVQKGTIFGYIDDKPVYRKTGKFGDYISYEGKNISLKPGDTIETITNKLETPSNTLHSIGEYVFKTGPYGKYMMKKTTAKGKKPIFVSIPFELDVTKLTEETAKNLYENGKNNSKAKKFYKKN
jgi:DNA topoisomerase-1